MSNAVKWALLAAAAVALIALVVALPFTNFINASQFANSINVVVNTCGDYFTSARGILNNFLTPFGRTVLTGLLYWLFGKWAIMIAIKIGAWIQHFVFK